LQSSISCHQHQLAKFYFFLSPAPPAADLHIRREHLTRIYTKLLSQQKENYNFFFPECRRNELGEAKEANEQQPIES
jgi:hypothetical protein